jgi:glucokinase
MAAENHNPVRFAVGVEVDALRVRACLYRADQEQLAKFRFSTKWERGPDVVMARIARCVRTVVDEADLQLSQVVAVGVGVSGVVEPGTGTVLRLLQPGWSGYPLQAKLVADLGLPVIVGNAGMMAARAAQAIDLPGETGRVLAVFQGPGITGGLLEQGKPVGDPELPFLPLTHLPLDPNGPLCACGQRGCLDSLAGGVAILRLLREAMDQGRTTCLAGHDLLGVGDWRKAAKRGDPLALELAQTTARYLGLALAKWLPLWQPLHVLLGGNIWEAAAEIMLPVARDTVLQELGPGSLDQVTFAVSQLGKAAGTVGAACAALESVTVAPSTAA